VAPAQVGRGPRCSTHFLFRLIDSACELAAYLPASPLQETDSG
jgi:hypothetical protein